MIRLLLAALFGGLTALSSPAEGIAATAQAALSPDDSAAVGRAVRYLNGISTLRARFVQISSNGTYAEGEVLVERPGKMRFEYDPPHPVLIIANGLTLLFYDRELKQASFLPLWETPLWFLIREKVTLSGAVRVVRVQRDRGALRVTLRDAKIADAGTVTLVFSDRPLALRKWEVVDTQGIRTEVALLNPRFGVPIDPQAFDYKDLEINTAPTHPSGR
ncbi:MAG: outer membrane lipoprotein carrier protein LolA [Kiloniellaceae bacterium]